MPPSSTPEQPASSWFQPRDRAASGPSSAADGAPPDRPDDAADSRDFRTALRLRLVAENTMDWTQGFRASERFAAGVRAAFVLDVPGVPGDDVAYVSDDRLNRHGGAAALFATALENTLTRERSDACIAIRSDPKDELPLGAFFQLTGRSPYVASLALDPARSARSVGIEPGPDGLFFALPSRNLLLMHAIRDATSQDSMNALALRAARAFRQAPGPITPNAFWWHDGRIDVISRHADDGRRTWSVPDELAAILMRHRRG